LKDNTPTLEIPLRENIELAFMETLVSSTESQVEGGRRTMASKGKGKLKEKVIEPPYFNTFVDVPLSQILYITDDVRRKRRATTSFVPPTLPLSGVQTTRQGSI
jgi:hypothetical protein